MSFGDKERRLLMEWNKIANSGDMEAAKAFHAKHGRSLMRVLTSPTFQKSKILGIVAPLSDAGENCACRSSPLEPDHVNDGDWKCENRAIKFFREDHVVFGMCGGCCDKHEEQLPEEITEDEFKTALVLEA